MLKKIITLLLALLLVIASFSTPVFAKEQADNVLGSLVEKVDGEEGDVQFAYASEAEMLADMSSVCSNDNFELYWSKKNLSIAVLNKKTGEIYTSNPYDAASDPMCTGDVEKNLESQIILSFYDSDYKQQGMWSSADCVKYGQFSAEIYENGLVYKLSLGEEKGEQLVPIAVEPAEFEGYLDKLDKKQQRKLNAFFTLYAPGEFFDQDKLDKYPILGKKELYVLDGELSDRERGELSEIFAAAGYNFEIHEKSMKALGIETEKLVYPNFKMNLEITLTEKGIDVCVPNDSIVCSEGFQLTEITVLPYFGCDKPAEGKDGYIFVPDGSGALININGQQDNRQMAIAGRVYGDNPVTDLLDEITEGKNYHLPIYGIVRNNGSAFAAITTSGDVADYIVALLAGPNGRYYAAYNRFLYTEYEASETEPKLISMGSTRAIYISDTNRYTCDYSVSYTLLSGDKASYVGMAEVYRDYIVSKGLDKDKKVSNDTVAVRTVGSALIDKDILGIPYKAEAVFTTYEDDINILKDLKEKGIEDVSLSLRGWEKRGLDASVSNKVRFSSALGGRSDFSKLAEYCKSNKIDLSLGAEFVFTKYNRAFDGLTIKKSIAQTLEISTAIIPEYSSFPELENNSIYVVSPAVYEKFSGKLFSGGKKKNISGFTLNSLGNELVGDFSSRHQVNRLQSLEIIEKLLKEGSMDLSLSFDGANAYVLPFASAIEDIPCSSSGLAGESMSVPFLQMVIGGNIKMSSEPINLIGDSNTGLLDCLRCGVAPTYLVAADNIEQLKKTDYSRYFAINYDYVSKNIVSNFERLSDATKAISGAGLINCYESASGVFVSEYDNGVSIVTNYNGSEIKFGDQTVGAADFLIIKK